MQEQRWRKGERIRHLRRQDATAAVPTATRARPASPERPDGKGCSLPLCVLAPLTTLHIQQSYLNVTHLLLCYWCIPQYLDGDGLKGAVLVIQVTGVLGKITTQMERIVQIPEIIGENHV